MPFLQLKLLHALFELLMKSNEKRDLLDEVTQLCCCILIDYVDILGQILECYHNLVQRMRLEQVSQRQRRLCDSFSLSVNTLTLTVVQQVDFSAMKRADLKAIGILSCEILINGNKYMTSIGIILILDIILQRLLDGPLLEAVLHPPKAGKLLLLDHRKLLHVLHLNQMPVRLLLQVK